MIPMKHFLVAFGFILVWFLLGSESRAANYKLERTNSPAEGLTSTLGSALQSEGYRIVNDSGKVWCEVWIRKEIANLNKPASTGAKYQSLHTGSLVGVIKFPSEATDYRGQPIKAGNYTLRYANVLQDGNHMGVSPILDFLLLIPVGDDTQDPDAELSFNEAVALSRKATGTNHPANLLMTSPPDSINEASVEKDDMNHWCLKVKIPQKPGGILLLGIVVVGQYEG
jgi:hypothetical protein